MSRNVLQSFLEYYNYSPCCRFPSLVEMKGEQTIIGLMETLNHLLQHKTHKDDRHPRWHVSLSPVRWFCSGANISRLGVMRLVNRGFGYSWTFSLHLRLECTGLAFQTLSPVTRETLAALESPAPCRRQPLLHPPPLHLQDITPILGSRAWKSKTSTLPVGGYSRRPAIVHIVFWFLIDLRAAKSSWSHKARCCLFI